MKLFSKVIIVIVLTILVYVSFLIISDVNSISNEFSNFQIEYLPIILILITSGYFLLILRWNWIRPVQRGIQNMKLKRKVLEKAISEIYVRKA